MEIQEQLNEQVTDVERALTKLDELDSGAHEGTTPVDGIGISKKTATEAIAALQDTTDSKRKYSDLSEADRRERRKSRIAYAKTLQSYQYAGSVSLQREVVLQHRRIANLYFLYVPFANMAFVSLERDGHLLPGKNASDRKQALVAQIRALHDKLKAQLPLAEKIIADGKEQIIAAGDTFFKPTVSVPQSTETIFIHDKHANLFLESLIILDRLQSMFEVMEWNEIRTNSEIKEIRGTYMDAWVKIGTLAVKTYGDLYQASRSVRAARKNAEKNTSADASVSSDVLADPVDGVQDKTE
ncbi:hypothetical protein [Flavobacterium sp.]|uniref:hypothetical protein n=1 Tax=Flavobacterium sp. TaxID=239 RepID=UPI00260B1842|nr:hypothetical protein [Flavobacterium sp.]